MTVYLDYAATTPVDARVAELVRRYMVEEYGNAGSRSHEAGARAKRAVGRAREQVASVVGVHPSEVTFTSGATEANNLAILGLAEHGRREGRTHVLTTAMEHKSVLEPVRFLGRRGFDVTVVRPEASGVVDPERLRAAVREDTLLVSCMHVNNETGAVQPISEVADLLGEHPAFLHVDAAQSFGKVLAGLEHPRIDLVSLSGHKVFAPKGVGALVARRRGRLRPPLTPLMFGGGQERKLRPGTLPVPLVAGLGLAVELALAEHEERVAACGRFREGLVAGLSPLKPVWNVEPARCVPHIASLAFPGVDSEAAMLALKGVIAVSNGSACTSSSHEPSHVLKAMGVEPERLDSTLRLSWAHDTPTPDWEAVVAALRRLGA